MENRRLLDSDLVSDALVLCGSFNPIHEGHIRMLRKAKEVTGINNAFYEMTLSNCDKGNLGDSQVLNRLVQFSQLEDPLLITDVPLFTQKSESIKNAIFAIGYDTFVRLMNLKYYNNSQ